MRLRLRLCFIGPCIFIQIHRHFQTKQCMYTCICLTPVSNKPARTLVSVLLYGCPINWQFDFGALFKYIVLAASELHCLSNICNLLFHRTLFHPPPRFLSPLQTSFTPLYPSLCLCLPPPSPRPAPGRLSEGLWRVRLRPRPQAAKHCTPMWFSWILFVMLIKEWRTQPSGYVPSILVLSRTQWTWYSCLYLMPGQSHVNCVGFIRNYCGTDSGYYGYSRYTIQS